MCCFSSNPICRQLQGLLNHVSFLICYSKHSHLIYLPMLMRRVFTFSWTYLFRYVWAYLIRNVHMSWITQAWVLQLQRTDIIFVNRRFGIQRHFRNETYIIIFNLTGSHPSILVQFVFKRHSLNHFGTNVAKLVMHCILILPAFKLNKCSAPCCMTGKAILLMWNAETVGFVWPDLMPTFNREN